ncbi:hypothetical protein M011DRAFT_470245 [Sporormia fimetaria CBS 119925]|uniref:Uncharacterized protein n=1 Tax=Sporormia fimetaria CBS 119925 TaxID=1340428 RepID=A0A6A6V608_9PLEO|nr:hypothetical protein M011DRAFT_470245 [Sporormia fimetaria CBS 119925]
MATSAHIPPLNLRTNKSPLFGLAGGATGASASTRNAGMRAWTPSVNSAGFVAKTAPILPLALQTWAHLSTARMNNPLPG